MGAQEPLHGSARDFVPSVLQKTGNNDADAAHITRHERKYAPTDVRLPQELEDELRRITKEFTVDTAKLKDIVDHFATELEEGLKKTHQNIVCPTPKMFHNVPD